MPKGKYIYKKKLLQAKINKYNHLFIKKVNHVNYESINTHSWYNMKIYKQSSPLFETPIISYDKIEHDGFFTKKYTLEPTENQKIILLKWLHCYTLMYNATIKYINTEWFKYKKTYFIRRIKKLKKNKGKLFKKKIKRKEDNGFRLNINFFKKKLKDDKIKIQAHSVITLNNNNISVDSHLLDYAINDALKSYKSCITNMKNRNIKYFRLRPLKINRNNQILKIEKLAFRENGFWISSLGDIMKINCKNFKYINNIHTVATLLYHKKQNTFELLLKYKYTKIKDVMPISNLKKGTKQKKCNPPKKPTQKIIKEIPNTIKEPLKIIAFDPGIRVTLTGYSNDLIIEIGTDCYERIKKILLIIDIINKSDKTESQKKKIIDKKELKIKNIVDDFHWKTINYITDNYDAVLIGNFSTKSMGESDTVNSMVKRVGNRLRFYEFKERLKYKCTVTGTEYKHIDEAYTSKCCCKCGNYNKKLGSNKRYKCVNIYCDNDIGRDINGSINIMINGLE
jgi:IS605 OrfB family transposase